MNVGVIHLLSKTVLAKDLIELGEDAGLAIGGGSVEAVFVVDQKLWCAGRRNEIQLSVFMDFLGRCKPEDFVSYDSAAGSKVVIPAQNVGRVCARNIGTIEDIVPVVHGREAAGIIAA